MLSGFLLLETEVLYRGSATNRKHCTISHDNFSTQRGQYLLEVTLLSFHLNLLYSVECFQYNFSKYHLLVKSSCYLSYLSVMVQEKCQFPFRSKWNCWYKSRLCLDK